jgi:hypothetical protein
MRVRLRCPHGRLENRQTHGHHSGIDALGIDSASRSGATRESQVSPAVLRQSVPRPRSDSPPPFQRSTARERRIYDFTGVLVQIGVLKAKPA